MKEHWVKGKETQGNMAQSNLIAGTVIYLISTYDVNGTINNMCFITSTSTKSTVVSVSEKLLLFSLLSVECGHVEGMISHVHIFKLIWDF